MSCMALTNSLDFLHKRIDACKTAEDKDWPFETGNETVNDITRVLFAILVGSIILLLF